VVKPIRCKLGLAALAGALALGAFGQRALAQADLSLTLTDSPDPVTSGQNVTYTLRVTNLGPAQATSVKVTNTLPAGFSFVSASVSGGGAATQQFAGLILTNNWRYEATGTDLGTAWRETNYNDSAWPVGAAGLGLETGAKQVEIHTPLALSNANVLIRTFYFRTPLVFTNPVAGANYYIQLTYTVDDGAVFYLNGAEIHRGTNMPTGTITYSTTPNRAQQENLLLTYLVPVTNLIVGTNIMAVEVHQQGTTSSDILFASKADILAVTGGGTFTTNGNNVIFDLGSMDVGVGAALTVVAKSGSPGTATNTASVRSTTTDNNLANNNATATTTVNALATADLVVSMTDAPDPVIAGSNLVYTIAITNKGGAGAADVILVDNLPPGVTFVSATITGGGSVTQTLNLVQLTNTWKYDESGTDLGTAWTALGFDDSAWLSGNAALANESGATAVPINTTLSLDAGGTRILTYYFRAPMVVNNITAGAAYPLELQFAVDDGAVWYVNGAEIYRTNMPAGEIVYTNLASSAATENVLLSRTVTVTNLVNGTNVLAVEVHQNSATSSDVMFASAANLLVSGPSYFTAEGSQVTFNLGYLAPGAGALLTVAVQPPVRGTITNTVSATTSSAEPTTTNNNATALTTVNAPAQPADIMVSVESLPGLVVDDQLFTNTVTVFNAGPGPATNVLLTNFVASGLTLISSSASAGGCTPPIGGLILCNLLSLQPNAQATVRLVLRGAVPGVYTNLSAAGAADFDPQRTNNAALAINTILPSLVADLSVSVVDSPDPVVAGEHFTNLVSVFNAGPSNATGVVLTNRLQGPYTLSAVRINGPGSTANLGGGVVVCYLSNLLAGAGVNVEFDLLATSAGLVTHTSVVRAVQYDTNSANNTAAALTTVNPAPVVDLVTTIMAAPSPVVAGANLTYEVGVTNQGNLNATGVYLTNRLPAQVSLVSLSVSQGACSNFNGVVVCDLGGLAGGSGALLTVVAGAPASGTLTNVAQAVSVQPDFNPLDNQTTNTVVVLADDSADLVLNLSATPTNLHAGQEVTFRLSLTNNGPALATGVYLTNWLPAGLTFVRASTTSGAFVNQAGTVVFSAGNLPKGSGLMISLVARADLAGSLTNVANSWAAQVDPVSNLSQAVIQVQPAADLALAVAKSADPVPSTEIVTYTVTVLNQGPSPATGVSVYDYLPSGSQFHGAFASQGSFTTNNGVILWTAGDLAPGLSATLDIDVVLGNIGVGVSTFGVLGNEFDPVASNNNVVVTTTTIGLGTEDGINITASTNAAAMAAALTASGASGIQVNRVELRAHRTEGRSSSGLYSIGTPNNYQLLLPGVVISTGNVRDYESGPNTEEGRTTAFGRPATAAQEALLDPITGRGTNNFNHFDVTQLDIYFDMLPGYDRVSFKVVFGSEEYIEFVNTLYIDGFGIYLDGSNIAYAADSPININHPDMMAVVETELDGVISLGGTNPVMTFSAPVTGGTANHRLTFIVADTSDALYDTTVFISALEGVQGANADLGLSGTAAPEPISVGNTVTYTLVVTNHGPSVATNSVLRAILSTTLTNITVVNTNGAFYVSNEVVQCELGNLDRRGTATLTITAEPLFDARFSSFFEVKSDLLDLTAANNYTNLVSSAVDFGSYYNPFGIVIRDGAQALPYPSIINVSGLTGVVDTVTVTLLDLNHTYPADLVVLLVAPDGRNTLLMSGAGAGFDLNQVSLRFDDAAGAFLPSAQAISSGIYRPSNLASNTFLPGLAGVTPPTFGAHLSGLRRSPANGDWKLYVYDSQGGDSGVIAGGWNLRITTAPDLTVNFAGGSLVIAWPALDGYVLEGTASLSGTPVWTPVGIAPVVSGGVSTVTVPISSGFNFFRLRK